MDSEQEELSTPGSPDIEQQLKNLTVKDCCCAYCGIDQPSCLAQCVACEKWFCNTKSSARATSHMISHLVISHHNQVKLHETSELGDTVLECFNCGNDNVFLLGYVPAQDSAVVVILCRLPCANKHSTEWDTSKWESLIENRAFLPWILPVPEENLVRPVSNEQISALETLWRENKKATLADIEAEGALEKPIEPILLVYDNDLQYVQSFSSLVEMEADFDRQLKESQILRNLSVSWSLSLNSRHVVSFQASNFESVGIRLALGEEMVLSLTKDGKTWKSEGYIIRIPSSLNQKITLELKPSKVKPPTDQTTGFTGEIIWKGVTFDRMIQALQSFAKEKEAVTPFIRDSILGHDVVAQSFDLELPQDLSIKHFAKLNKSQNIAVSKVLRSPFSLIQGPPGTGKTVTSATIVYHLIKMKHKVLVCAPSNVAVDHLVEKLSSLKLNVVRLAARSREDTESSVDNLSLHRIVADRAGGELKKLMQLKEELGELSSQDSKTYAKLQTRLELRILKQADVICATCSGAGDRRLKGLDFSAVLIDESTQATEPECLIPIVKGVQQVILVGDHQQLGPICLDTKVAKAGLQQSLFERLILVGHTPIRLEVQYRMHPCLSEFPSNAFYEGSLQNGVSAKDRKAATRFPWPVKETPMMFWVNYGKEELSSTGVSYLNRVEALGCEQLITKLFENGVKASQIGVITPYEGQRAYVVQYLASNCTLVSRRTDYTEVEVESVDAFQGREKDYIILSCVRANDYHGIGFLRDPRRMNVALTRAKYGLVVMGNPVSLSNSVLWNSLLVHFRQNGCLVEGPLDNLQLSSVQLKDPKKPHRKQFESENFNPANAGPQPFGSNYGMLNNFDSSFGAAPPPGFDFFGTNSWPVLSESSGNSQGFPQNPQNVVNFNSFEMNSWF